MKNKNGDDCKDVFIASVKNANSFPRINCIFKHRFSKFLVEMMKTRKDGSESFQGGRNLAASTAAA